MKISYEILEWRWKKLAPLLTAPLTLAAAAENTPSFQEFEARDPDLPQPHLVATHQQ